MLEIVSGFQWWTWPNVEVNRKGKFSNEFSSEFRSLGSYRILQNKSDLQNIEESTKTWTEAAGPEAATIQMFQRIEQNSNVNSKLKSFFG